MKSERRHELETNSLALWLRFRAPELLQQHGTKILLGIVVVALAVVLIRHRIESPKKAAASAANYLALAREQITELKGLRRLPSDASVIRTQIQTAIDQSDDSHIQAEAHAALGDYYWALATWPELPAAATQPQLRPAEPRDELLEKAEAAYRKVLAQSDVKPYLSAAARFGLAAIEETRGFEAQSRNAATPSPHWATAREHYEAVANAEKMPQVLKNQAAAGIERLDVLRQPVWVVAATQPTTDATTIPSTTGPSTTTAATRESVTAAGPATTTAVTTAPATRPVQ